MATDTSKPDRSVIAHLTAGRLTLLLVLVGVVLILVPEPITSLAGVVMILVGVGRWIAGRV